MGSIPGGSNFVSVMLYGRKKIPHNNDKLRRKQVTTQFVIPRLDLGAKRSCECGRMYHATIPPYILFILLCIWPQGPLCKSLPLKIPTKTRTEGLSPVWGSEFTTKAVTSQGDSSVVVVCDWLSDTQKHYFSERRTLT